MAKYCAKWLCKDKDGRPYIVQSCISDHDPDRIDNCTLISHEDGFDDNCVKDDRKCEDKITAP
jgi:hypothetical protein